MSEAASFCGPTKAKIVIANLFNSSHIISGVAYRGLLAILFGCQIFKEKGMKYLRFSPIWFIQNTFSKQFLVVYKVWRTLQKSVFLMA